jgi:hypothetical protein
MSETTNTERQSMAIRFQTIVIVARRIIIHHSSDRTYQAPTRDSRLVALCQEMYERKMRNTLK